MESAKILTPETYATFGRNLKPVTLPQRGLNPLDIQKIYRENGLWREVSVGAIGKTSDPIQAKVVNDLLQSFHDQGHEVFRPSEEGKLRNAPKSINLLFAHLNIPYEGESLFERIPDDPNVFIGAQIKNQFGVRKTPGHLVGFATIKERLSEMSHQEVVDIDRRTVLTPEGGAISIPVNGSYENAIIELRDTLLTLEMAEELPTSEERSTPFSLNEFNTSPTPQKMIETGHHLDRLRYLRPPFKAREHTRVRMKLLMLDHFVGSQGWAEAAWLEVDPLGSISPGIGTVYMTATGGDGADKRDLKRSDVVPVGRVVNGKLQVFPVPGLNTKKSSVEARELKNLVDKSRKIRVRKEGNFYIPDPKGEIITSVWAAFMHLHVDYTHYDPNLVVSLDPNIGLLPFGVGCGTDLMALMSSNNAERAEALMKLDDFEAESVDDLMSAVPLDYPDRSRSSIAPTEEIMQLDIQDGVFPGGQIMVAWPVNRHGLILGIPWGPPILGKDGEYHQGLEAMLELIDPDSYGAVVIDRDNIPQFPQGSWQSH